MISERKFATGYSSVWRSILPLSEPFTRALNTQRKHFLSPYTPTHAAEKSTYISEFGFRLFAASHNKELSIKKYPPQPQARFLEIAHETQSYIQSLSNHEPLSDEPNQQDHQDAIEIASRLLKFFSTVGANKRLNIQPCFKGCGVIDSCYGDVLSGSTLWEIKNVDRDFRAVDLRQLLVYAALAKAATTPSIDHVGLLNARQGAFIRISLDTLALGMSGASAAELLARIIHFISTDQVSR